MVPIAHETSERVVRTMVFGVPPAALVVAGWLAWGGSLHWHDLVVLAITYLLHRARHHRRLSTGCSPTAASRPRARVRALLARARLDGGRGPGDRVGLHPPQAPPLLRPPRRSAQPPCRPRAGLARGAARARATRTSAGCSAARTWPTRAATRRTCSPTATCASSAAPSRSGSAAGLALPFGLGVALTGTLAGGLTGLLWGGAVRIFLLHHATFSINSLCHFFGRRPFATGDRVAQPRLARADRLRRGLAQQPPRLPDLRPSRPRPLAARPRRLADRRRSSAATWPGTSSGSAPHGSRPSADPQRHDSGCARQALRPGWESRPRRCAAERGSRRAGRADRGVHAAGGAARVALS